jgi:hypothetical protein
MVVEFGHLKPRSEPALQNSAGSEKSLATNPSHFQKFRKIRRKPKKIGRNEVEPREEQEKILNPKFGRFDRIIEQGFKKFDHFLKTVFTH